MDSISDFFTRIRNAYRARKASVTVPYSGMKAEIARILEARGYIGGIEKKGRKVRKFLELELAYKEGRPALSEAKSISKPSRRLYAKRSEIRPVRQGHGMLIISTSKGLMTDEEARKSGLGGELIAQVW